MSNSSQAFVTLCTNDTYAVGAMVLAYSIKNVGTTRKLCVIITNDVSESVRHALSLIFDHIELVSLYDSNDSDNLALLKRPDLGCTFTKLHCWKLTQYSKCIFIDADCLVIKPIDELFEREELSAAPDLGWPDCFNSGVFVYVPSIDTYNNLIKYSLEHRSFDGADQGLLNSYFSDWSFKDIKYHLPFIYNVVPSIFYSYIPALLRYKPDIKIAHFLGERKPWRTSYDPQLGIVNNVSVNENDFYAQWWKILYDNVVPSLGPILTQTVLPVKFEALRCSFVGSQEHQQAWERGEIDYTGADSFDNIRKFLDEILENEQI
ncbi:hypothetical protein GJ496_005212 [Pomphorhynchus laevis]|nr:hypothetical protein GJ496_005212 [Pomphorhynchus laevis]